jgi:hypothetical protein
MVGVLAGAIASREAIGKANKGAHLVAALNKLDRNKLPGPLVSHQLGYAKVAAPYVSNLRVLVVSRTSQSVQPRWFGVKTWSTQPLALTMSYLLGSMSIWAAIVL